MTNPQSIASDWGSLFGISASELTDKQLSKVSFAKLIELTYDPRVENLLIDKLEKAEAWEQERIHTVEEQLSKLNNFKVAYNNWIQKGCPHQKQTNTSSYYYTYHYRQHTILWSLLDDLNKEKEFDLYSRGAPSILNFKNLDFEWMWSKQPEKTKELTANFLKNSDVFVVSNALEKLPEEQAKELLPLLFQRKDKRYHVAALDSPHLPNRFIIKALKTWAKIVHNPKIRAKIKISHLNRLPPITRLEVLEKLVYKNLSTITDIQNEEELKQLVFSSMTRHYQRVQHLLKEYHRYNRSEI